MSEHTILVADADKEIARSLEENILELNGNYTVKTSHDGKDALEILEKEKVDLVILDIQIPVINGLQLLTELHNKGIWLPIIIITESDIKERDSKLREFGIVDFIKKPFLPEKVVIRLDEIMKNREKKDLIKNFGLPSILQLIEMEKRTGILTLKIGKENGRVFFRNGKIMDVEVKGVSTGEALEELIHSLYEDREISIEYIDHKKDKKINMTLMEMVMEASRIKDEKGVPLPDAGPEKGNKKITKKEDLSVLADLLDPLKEVESYIVADENGDVHLSSPENYNEEVLNFSIYLWVIGDKTGADFNLGEPANLTCYLKGKRRFIRKYKDLIIILELTEMTKCSAFKEKLNELINGR